ncbi:MAG: polysaccharide biosynthesis/export family protein [Lentimicrobiaceae bacterium]|jgi:polysaccharide export outer membrane protein|nr:polysaccharide biosynthesis/export family protein [Lentimicrobiaceae bacterium]
MKISFIKLVKQIVVVSFLSCLIVSCVPQKRIKYLQQSELSDTTSVFQNERGIAYLIQPGDNLYIKVMSMDEKTSNLFNVASSIYQNYTSDASIYLNSYTVNEQGYIEFPLAGSVSVKNMTVEHVKEKIQQILDEYLKETVLIVKLVNFNITVLGEVKRPGQYKIYQSEINIFEAISMAGDLTDFSKRNNVKIIRQTKNGSEIITVDLEQASILSSDYYYMRPNDIVYVEPLKIKQFGFAAFPYATIFSGISTILLLINYFK